MSLQISDDAVNLIVTEEVSGQLQYVKHYEHLEWPAGASGPTIAIGYDCGYVTRQEATADWSGVLSADMLAVIMRGCGLRGEIAGAFVRMHKAEVTVTWDQAMTEFRGREIPKWIGRVAAHLPNLDKLAPDSLGAIVSLAYNRGPSFDAPREENDAHDRYREMRAIKAHMAACEFAKIPAEFASMQRLWPQGGDLWRRRAHEAALFRKGLSAPTPPAVAPVAAPAPTPAPAPAAPAAPIVPASPVVSAPASVLPAIEDTLARLAAYL